MPDTLAVLTKDGQFKVVAAEGHWYALDGDELCALPQSADDTDDDAPAGFGNRDGWYAPEDLPADTRDRIVAALKS